MKLNEVFSLWDHVHDDLLGTLDKFSDAELAFRPFPSSWSVGQIALHIADCSNGWFCSALDSATQWPPDISKEEHTTVAAIKATLDETHVMVKGYLEPLTTEDLTRPVHMPWGEEFTLGWVIWHVLEHEIHHRGELSLILGMLGREGVDV